MSKPMAQPHWTLIEFITDVVAVASVTTPTWMVPEDELRLHLQIASLVLGCIWIFLRITMLLTGVGKAWWRGKKKGRGGNGREGRK